MNTLNKHEPLVFAPTLADCLSSGKNMRAVANVWGKHVSASVLLQSATHLREHRDKLKGAALKD